MTAGTPLKTMFSTDFIDLLAESFAAVETNFDVPRFRRNARNGLDELELKPRAAHLAKALARELPDDFDKSSDILVRALGPELTKTEGNGLATFFYLPHSSFVEQFAGDCLKSGLRACHELTRRFSAEFCIRPLLVRSPEATLETLAKWVDDKNPHVRRLVSEGTRPRLPWGLRLKLFQAEPHWTLPLLERLKDDPEEYVRRSVANHLGDLLKDHPEAVFGVCRRWLEECDAFPTTDPRWTARRALIRHAVRHPAQRGVAAAVEIRVKAGARLR